jgi:hypothetical protein
VDQDEHKNCRYERLLEQQHRQHKELDVAVHELPPDEPNDQDDEQDQDEQPEQHLGSRVQSWQRDSPNQVQRQQG